MQLKRSPNEAKSHFSLREQFEEYGRSSLNGFLVQRNR